MGTADKSKKDPVDSTTEWGIELDEAVSELSAVIEHSVSFIQSEFESDWAKAERYFGGAVDAPNVPGRSTQVKTEVRDAIRNVKPSIMRTLLHARKPVEYEPSSIQSAAFIEQQSIFVNQLFWRNDGYRTLLSAVDEALKKKIGPIKTWWEVDPLPDYVKMTCIDAETLQAIQAAPDCEVSTVEVSKKRVTQVGETNAPVLYDIEYHKYSENGCIRMEAIPAHEFFINRNATSVEDSVAHGHRRDVTVSEAISMGLEFDNWEQLDSEDPELHSFAESSRARRGYTVNYEDDLQSQDITQHNFLLTEVYCWYDLEGTGRPQRYCFYLGGTGYTYISHHEVSDWCIDVVSIDPVPFTVYGRSLADLTVNEQDTMTSLLRATIDNAHMSNNPRHIGDPVGVDFNDLVNNAIGAPIKRKGNAQLDTVMIPFTGQGLLPLLDYLGRDIEEKVGITKAATGLDPNAMQSTDKDAVRNTIALAQGQVELMVRNVIETGLIPVFKRMLRLSIAHMDRTQIIRTKGTVIPVDISVFDPDLSATPRVGLGTNSPEDRMNALSFVLGKQEQIIGQFGMDNPFCSLTNVYNTLEDMVELSGLYDVGRYFRVVTPDIERKLAEQRQKAAEEAKQKGEDNSPMDPSKALTLIEAGKSRVKTMEILARKEQQEKELQIRALEGQEKLDIERDKMEQDRVIDLLKIEEAGRKARADTQIRRAQEANKVVDLTPKEKPDETSTSESERSSL